MALQIKHDDYTPNWNGKELNLQALGLDQYDTVWGGTTSFDFSRPDLIANTLRNGDEIQSLRVGANPVIASGVMAGDGTTPLLNSIHTDKGLPLYKNRGPLLDLPQAFNLTEYGATPSAVIYAWIRKTDLEAASIFTAALHNGAMNSGANAQWIFGINSGKFTFTVGSSGQVQTITAPSVDAVGEYLLSMFIQKTSNSRFIAHAYVNNVKIGTADRAYPLNNPQLANPSFKPQIGTSSGSGGMMKCILRRCGVRHVDPLAYGVMEHEAWIAEQIAANSQRFP